MVEVWDVHETTDPVGPRVEAANALKEEGNQAFAKGKYAEAVNRYQDALMRLPPRIQDEEDRPANSVAEDEHMRQTDIVDLRVKIHANMAACHLKLVCVPSNRRNNTKKPSRHRRKVGDGAAHGSFGRESTACQGFAQASDSARAFRRMGPTYGGTERCVGLSHTRLSATGRAGQRGPRPRLVPSGLGCGFAATAAFG